MSEDPLLMRLSYFLRLYTLKALVRLALTVQPYLAPLPPSKRPTFIKSYPCRPSLKVRIFLPPSYDHKKGPLPIYLDIHGGGFAILAPQVDDEFNSFLTSHFNICVASLQYGLAPGNRFPGPVHDIAALTQAILQDESLPIGRANCAIGGFSAGGNLAFAVSQLSELRGKIKACVGFYPVVDFVKRKAQKLAERPGGKDGLKWIASSFDWGYIPRGTDRADPLLSPTYYKQREDLPEKCYLISAEEDMLAREAEVMACKLASISDGKRGTGKLDGVDAEDGWEAGWVRWEIVRGQPHGFTHKNPWMGDGEAEQRRQQVSEMLFLRVGGWLEKAVFAVK